VDAASIKLGAICSEGWPPAKRIHAKRPLRHTAGKPIGEVLAGSSPGSTATTIPMWR
jgi:hypothetical protein